MIVTAETSGRIMTRSRAKAQPGAEAYQQVPVGTKIVKLLVEELASAASAAQAAPATPGLAKVVSGGGDAAEEGSDGDESDWEDELGAESAELLKFANEEPGSAVKAVDAETLGFLEGWFRGVGGQPGFVEGVFEQLNEGEKDVLKRLG